MAAGHPITRERGRPVLLAIVVGVVLVLVGVTASALVAITSSHLSTTTLNTVASRDAALIAFFVNSTLSPDDLAPGGPSAARVADLNGKLDTLTGDGSGAALDHADSILRVELRDLDGRVVASNDRDAVGLAGLESAAMAAARAGTAPPPALIGPGDPVEAAGGLPNGEGMVEEYLPILDGDGEPVAVVGLWRDAGRLLASLEQSRRDIMVVTLFAGALLAAILFLVFRGSQARLSRQHRQLMDATKTDALTGLLNHGAVVTRLTEELELAREGSQAIGVALLDVDNFRLFNDTHGHDAADLVLLKVAELVGREQPDAIVARYGPDEFLVVRPGATVTDIERTVDALRRDLEQESVQFGDSERLPISVSVGISAYPDHADSVTELLSAAAVALGEAKASGGDVVRVARVGEEERVMSGSLDVLQGLVIAVDTKDRYTKRHSEDVARYAAFLAQRIGLDEEMLRTIHLAGLLHDIGKIGIPDVVLRKPSKLTDDEYRMFQQHVALGDAIVRDVPNVEIVRAGIRHHHERWDGEGYLEHLAGEEIPVIGRILAVADAFSAMTTTRPYRKALSVTEALKRLGGAAGTQLQEELVTEFITGIETDANAPLPGEEPVQMWRPELWVA
jgi:diguanylate cyclase (GGDEF)-like protein/putative nucleotidyltransferase with HDIG domain